MITIGIAGGTGAGKSTFVRNIQQQLQDVSISILPQDAYYHANTDITEEERKAKNYDHPDAIDWELLYGHITQLKNGNSILQPVYSMLTCSRSNAVVHVTSSDIILVEGILLFTQQRIRDLFDIKIFIDAKTTERFDRVLQRDLLSRGRNAEQVNARFLQTVQPMHETFIEPSKTFADIIIAGGGENMEGVQNVMHAIKQRL